MKRDVVNLPYSFSEVLRVFEKEFKKEFPDVYSAIEINFKVEKAMVAAQRAWDKIKEGKL